MQGVWCIKNAACLFNVNEPLLKQFLLHIGDSMKDPAVKPGAYLYILSPLF